MKLHKNQRRCTSSEENKTYKRKEERQEQIKSKQQPSTDGIGGCGSAARIQ